jgi:hypothetical protein
MKTIGIIIVILFVAYVAYGLITDCKDTANHSECIDFSL